MAVEPDIPDRRPERAVPGAVGADARGADERGVDARGADARGADADAANARPTSYAAFWPRYLALHRAPGSRALHYLGSLVGPALLIWGLVAGPLWLVALSPVAGYGFAWLGHFAIEGNRPATFGHPVWSLASDYRMLGLWLAGRLGDEYRRQRIG